MVLAGLVITTLLALVVITIFLLGFRLGGDHGAAELARIRLETLEAEARLHDLTRHAFVAMADAVDQRSAEARRNDT